MNCSLPIVLVTDLLPNPRILWSENSRRVGAIIHVGGAAGIGIQFCTKENRAGPVFLTGTYITYGKADDCTFELRVFNPTGAADCPLEICEIISRE
jgi:hypothetical protein